MSATGSLSSTSTNLVRRTTNSVNLSSEERDLWELCYYAGVIIDPQIFHVLVDLLNMDIDPNAVLKVLKTIAPYSKFASKENISNKHVSEITKKDVKQFLSHKQASSTSTVRGSQASKLNASKSEFRKSASIQSGSSDRQTSSARVSKGKSSSVLIGHKPSSDRSKSTAGITVRK